LKAAPFLYVKPKSIDEAVALKERHGASARYLAGGQSLMPVLNFRLDRPDLLIDINGLSELRGVSNSGSGVKIGALTRHAEVAKSEIVKSQLALLSECIPHIAHPAIRSGGTFGGSVALADPAAEWPACCLALDARIVLRSSKGERRVEAKDYFLGLYDTARTENELLIRVEFPAVAAGTKAVALELARRRGDFAIAGVLAQAKKTGVRLENVRVVFFGISDRPVRLSAVEQGIAEGQPMETIHQAIDAGINPDDDIYQSGATKTHLAKVLLGRAVEQLRQ